MPAVRIAQADVDMQQDTDVLTCGACQKAFALGDIVKFIQHKVLACNKENYGCNESGPNNGESGDSDGEVGVMTRRPSISAPMKRSEEPRCSTPKRRATASPNPIISELDSTPPSSSPEEGPCKKLRTDVVDAQSNTTNSEPSNYVCSTCKARLHSAWRLVQHVQNSHGIKIYVESSSSVSMSSFGSSPGTSIGKNHSSSSTCSSTSPGCSVAPPSTPLALPPPSAPVASPRLPSPLIDPHLPLHNPFTVGGLLRMPLEPARHHQFTPSSMASGGSLFPRPSSHSEHHFRMEQLVSEQFRHHPLGLAAAVAAAVPPPHFGPPPNERPPPTSRSLPPPPSLPLSLEPQIDFYSQRLRQLAGTTSPGAANGNSSPSPRKLTPPFTSPTNSLPTSVSLAPSLMFNNNNNSSTNNNNIPTSTARSPTPRPQQSTPPTDQKPPPVRDSPPQETVDLTSTPRSASTPPAKPDFSDNQNSENMDVSEANRIHPCEYCGKKFRFQSNLLVHKRSHTGEKPYKCSVCNHACSQSSKLKRHMKVHKRSRSKTSGGEDGNPNGSGSVNSTPDQMSNAGSVETLDDEDDDDDDIDEEDDEEEDEEDEEEMEMEEEEGDEDDDLGGDAPEDLTTKSTSSTPPNTGEPKGGSGSPAPDKTSSGSLVGELMDKFGLSNIQQYSEAYKAALQESVGAHPLISRKDDLLHRSHLIDNNNSGSKPSPTGRLENGLLEKSAALRFREEFAKNIITGQPQLDLVGGPHGLFGHTFENPFDGSKRAKLDGRELGRPGDRDMYAGLWFPGLSAHHREQMFGANGGDSNILKDKKCPTTPGTSLAAAAAAAAALNLGLPSQNMKKDSKRNDTCEFCGKVFKNCSNLTVHRRSHTGEKPYKCELCSYACAQSSKLTRHMKTHGRMGKDVYRCRFCEMPFSVPSTLEKHMRKCVVNQNIKVEHMIPSIMSGDEDSAASTPKDTAST